MGGIADYSGALVLQLPLSCQTTVTIDEQDAPRVDVTSTRGDVPVQFGVEIERLTTELREPAALRTWIKEEAGDLWPAYVLGVVQWCLLNRQPPRTTHHAPLTTHGVRLHVESTVPEGSGVSSSAALEVATMRAVLAATGQEMAPEAMATACQWVENHVVGAPCGIMDQMTSACGRTGQLLRLRCQPARVEGFAAVPSGYRFYGIDSGVRHAVTGADYGTVRAAAFMGLRMLADLAGEEATRWGGYLARVSPEEFARYQNSLPDEMPGAEFLGRYGGTTDAVTTVEPGRVYPVRRATRHPVLEQQRVERFLALLGELDESPDASADLGRLMRGSHDSYGACGLGSAPTDRLVRLVEEAGAASGLFGARITGGGSGGTVAILGTDAAAGAVARIAARYREETGRGGTVFG